jgi:uncharacterized membrane protein YtjA (UPF0391 family)
MLKRIILFMILTILAAILGFSGIESVWAGVARLLFFVFLFLYIISLLSGGIRRKDL